VVAAVLVQLERQDGHPGVRGGTYLLHCLWLRRHRQDPCNNAAGGAAARSQGWCRTFAPAGGQHGPQAMWRRRMAAREARHQGAPVLAEAAPRPGCRHRADRRLPADQQGRGRRLPGRPFAGPDPRFHCLVHGRRRLRSGRCHRQRRRTSSASGYHRAAARECGAERDGRDRTDTARPPSPARQTERFAGHRRARPHGPAKGIRLHQARPSRDGHGALQAGDW